MPDDTKWKYIYVKRRLYDAFVDRTTERHARLIARLATLEESVTEMEKYVDNHAERLHALEARKGK